MKKENGMKKIVVSTLAVFLVAGLARANTVTASDDGYVRYSSADNGTADTMRLQEHVSGNNYCKSYIKFDASSLVGKAVTNATLSLAYAARNTEANHKIGVWGISSASWTEETIDRDTAPSNNHPSNEFSPATYLGDFTLNTTNGAVAYGDVFTFSSEALVSFLNTVTNDAVTIGLNVEVLDGVQNSTPEFATHESSSYAAPTLEMDLVPAAKEAIATYQDSYIQYNNPNGNYGTATTLYLQQLVSTSDANGIYTNARKAYVKFSIPPTEVLNATLDFVVDHDNVTGGATEFANIGVYGINDSPNQDDWAEIGIRWNNAPENRQEENGFDTNVTFLGNIAINNSQNGGTLLSLSSQALVDFVNADTDGKVSIALNFTKTGGPTPNYGVWLAARENATHDAPTLKIISEASSIPVGDIAIEIIDGGTNLTVTWDSVIGANYALESIDSLVTGSWADIQTNIPGTGQPISSTNSVQDAQSFYRVYIGW